MLIRVALPAEELPRSLLGLEAATSTNLRLDSTILVLAGEGSASVAIFSRFTVLVSHFKVWGLMFIESFTLLFNNFLVN